MDGKFAERMHHLDGGFTPLNFLFPNLPLPSYKRRDKAQKEMSDFYVNIMKKRDEGESEVSHPYPSTIKRSEVIVFETASRRVGGDIRSEREADR